MSSRHLSSPYFHLRAAAANIKRLTIDTTRGMKENAACVTVMSLPSMVVVE